MVECNLQDERTTGITTERLTTFLTTCNIGKRYLNADMEKCLKASEIKAYLKNAQENIAKGRGMFFNGPVGTGKTCSLVVLLKKLIQKFEKFVPEFDMPYGEKRPVSNMAFKFVSAAELFEDLRERDSEQYWTYWREYCAVQCLFIDDFLAGHTADWAFGRFEAMIDYRYSNMMPVFISSNLTAEQMKEPNLQRVLDRWRDSCDIIQIGGKSMRGQDK